MQDSKFIFLPVLTFLPDVANRSSMWNYVIEPLLRLNDSQGMDKDNKEILDDGMFLGAIKLWSFSETNYSYPARVPTCRPLLHS